MLNFAKQGRLARSLGTLAVIGLVGTGCQDLQVDNLLEPDRERAAGNPADVQALIGGGFYPNFFRPMHGTDGGLSGTAILLFTYAGSDFTATLAGGLTAVWHLDLLEPRREHPNAAAICSTICEWAPRDFWGRIGSAMSIAFDGLVLLDAGTVIMEEGVNRTPRARAFAKFMQGWVWGASGMIFDQTNIVPETVDLNDPAIDISAIATESLEWYDVVIENALNSLDEAIAVAQANPDVVHYPSEEQSALWWGTATPMTNTQFIQFANTIAARLYVLSARTPQERADLDWQRVLDYTANGIQPGNEPLFQLSSQRTSNILARAQNNTTGGSYNARWSYYTIGMADQSGNYQDWISAPLDQRTRFDITTPDRRITGSTTDPQTNGTYTCYRSDNNGFLSERGEYLFSAYQWARHKLKEGISCAAPQLASNSGTLALATADENNLLRAEALLRTNQVQAAVDLINITRTREHMGESLPPLTVDGVPTDANGHCVPRMDNGDCGTVMTALRYERMVELAGMDLLRGYGDSRGFGMLPDGALQHFPIPGNVLDLYGLPNYTYGGVGNEGTLMYAPVN
jgi:hypothetical protein